MYGFDDAKNRERIKSHSIVASFRKDKLEEEWATFFQKKSE